MAEAAPASRKGSFSFELTRPVELGSPDEFLTWVQEKLRVPVPSIDDLESQVPSALRQPIASLAHMKVSIDELAIRTGDQGYRRFAASVDFTSTPVRIANILELAAIRFSIRSGKGATLTADGTIAKMLLRAAIAGQPLELAAALRAKPETAPQGSPPPSALEFSGGLAEGAALDLAKLLGALFAQVGFDPPANFIPRITLTELGARYVSNTFALDCALSIGKAVGSAAPDKVQLGFAALDPGCLIGLNFESDIGLEIDVLRGVIGDLSLSQLRVLFASAAIDDVPELLGKLVPSDAKAGTKKAVAQGISFGARLGSKTQGHDLTFAPPAEAARPKLEGAGAGASPSAKPPATKDASFRKWLQVDKTFGPLSVRRVGGEWNGGEGRLGVLFDAGVDLFGLQVDLAGLKVSLPVSDPSPANVRVDLDGLNLALRAGPVDISGGLLRVDKEFTGTALIKTEAFGISGFGSYTLLDTGPSLFIYALLDMDLGGPPCFHVTGLAAGFGYHRALKIPEIEKVHEFPLIQAAMEPAKFRSLGEMCAKIADCSPVAPGEYWLAAGVRFTSFEMIRSFALIAVGFGTETVITGLGLSQLTVPPPVPGTGATATGPLETIVSVEVALKICLRPERGVLTAEARLTPNSWVFSKDCKLTGGFAFYLWFKDVQEPGKPAIPAGDFVVTLGGYHPRFTAPEHYPVVPRLGLAWQVGECLRIAGEVYFALTPTCLMAGGSLSALFHDGELRAWFDAHAHFFVSWKPLHYDIEAGVRVGVSCGLSVIGISYTVSVEMSATVHMWGPPFEGQAEIHWTVISFTVSFGEHRETPAPLTIAWPEFVQSCLPRSGDGLSADPLAIAVTRGVISDVKAQRTGEQDYLIVNAHQAVVTVKSAVPSTSIAANGGAPLEHEALGIRPIGITQLDAAETTVHVTLKDEVTFNDHPVTLKALAIRDNVPAALWAGTTFDPQANQKPELIGGVLTGVQMAAPPPAPVNTYPIEDLDHQYDRPPHSPITWRYRYAPAGKSYEPQRVVEHIITCRTAGQDVVPARREMLEALAKRGLIDGVPPALDDAYRSVQLEDSPVECGLGMLPLRSRTYAGG